MDWTYHFEAASPSVDHHATVSADAACYATRIIEWHLHAALGGLLTAGHMEWLAQQEVDDVPLNTALQVATIPRVHR